ncbi:MAG: hypothetical protein WC718_18500 [Phycisphaerales bacterium]|jgi:hypothetical protein
MNVYEVFPSKYVRAGDLPERGVTVTMERVTIENLHAGEGRKKEAKPVLWFRKATKGLVLNKTNAFIIADLYGPDMDNWTGHRIELYPTRVDAFGSMQDAVRVRERRFDPQPATATEKVSEIESPEDVLDYDEPEQAADASTGEVEYKQADAPAAQRSAPPVQPQADVDGDVLFGKDTEPPTDEEHALIGSWEGQTIGVWHAWATAECGVNVNEAKNSLKKIVDAHGGWADGKNAAAIALAYIRRQREKVAAQTEPAA